MKLCEKITLWAGLAASLTLISGPAWADWDDMTPEKISRFDVYLDTPEMDEYRLEHLRLVRDTRHPACLGEPVFVRVTPSYVTDDAYAWSADVIGIYPPNAMAPNIAMWNESYEVDYCGQHVRENATLLIVEAGSRPGIIWSPPGDTRGETRWSLADDIVGRIEVFAQDELSTRSDNLCTDEFDKINAISNTSLPEPFDEAASEWTELWSVSHCGVAAELTVTVILLRRSRWRFTAVEMETGIELPRLEGERTKRTREEEAAHRRRNLRRSDPYARD